jgi:hypothetical protein
MRRVSLDTHYLIHALEIETHTLMHALEIHRMNARISEWMLSRRVSKGTQVPFLQNEMSPTYILEYPLSSFSKRY